ncbi:MAG: hypothetical protein WCC87_26095 [Candidatus Korobacteraceae bacterium]
MSEKVFQKALIHLYANIDRYSSYSEKIFEEFPLSLSEKQSLQELMTTQRDGLVAFNQQLHHKRCRIIRHALPISRGTLRRQLDTLLDTYECYPAAEGACQPSDAVRCFADYISSQIECQTEASRDLQFIRFEAIYASLSLHLASADSKPPHPVHLSAEIRLSSDRSTSLILCTYNVLAAMKDPSLLKGSEGRLRPCWIFLFRTSADEVKALAVAPKLAKILKMFQSGLSLEDILNTLDSETDKLAATVSVDGLLSLGVPFFCHTLSGDRLLNLAK